MVTKAAYDCKYPFWSPDGKRLYYVSLATDRDGIWSVGAAGGTPQVVVEDATRGAISPDGRTLAILRDEQHGDIVGAAALYTSSPVMPATETHPGWSVAAGGRRARIFTGRSDARDRGRAANHRTGGRAAGMAILDRAGRLERAGSPTARWLDRRGATSGELLVAARRPPCRARGPDRVDTRLTSLGGRPRRDRAWPLTEGPGTEHDPSVSPFGDRVVFTAGEPDYDLMEVPLDAPASRRIIATARSEMDPSWSPDGTTMAYVTDRRGHDEIWLHTHEIEPWGDRPVITQADFGDDRTIMLGTPAFSPDGSAPRLPTQRDAPIWPLRIWISLIAGGPPVPLLPATHEGYQSAPTWSPDGDWIAYTEWKDDQWLLAKVRVGSGEAPVVLRRDGVPNATPRWSPTGDWITWETSGGIHRGLPGRARPTGC